MHYYKKMADESMFVQEYQELFCECTRTVWKQFLILLRTTTINRTDRVGKVSLLKNNTIAVIHLRARNCIRKMRNANMTFSAITRQYFAGYKKFAEELRNLVKKESERLKQQRTTRRLEETTRTLNYLWEDFSTCLTNFYDSNVISDKDIAMNDDEERGLERCVFTVQTEKDEWGGIECLTCLEEFKPGETITILSCAHKHHTKCIVRWLKLKPTCPYCVQYFLIRYD